MSICVECNKAEAYAQGLCESCYGDIMSYHLTKAEVSQSNIILETNRINEKIRIVVMRGESEIASFNNTCIVEYIKSGLDIPYLTLEESKLIESLKKLIEENKLNY